MYLNEAEKILEYVANRGKAINRNLIIAILHNEAVCYQQQWDLERCSNYIEALIYNINCDLKDSEFQSPIGDELHTNHSLISNESGLISIENIGKKTSLATYYMLFCAINSQLKNNSAALIAAKKSNVILRNTFKELSLFIEKTKCFKNIQQDKGGKLNIIQDLANLP